MPELAINFFFISTQRPMRRKFMKLCISIIIIFHINVICYPNKQEFLCSINGIKCIFMFWSNDHVSIKIN